MVNSGEDYLHGPCKSCHFPQTYNHFHSTLNSYRGAWSSRVNDRLQWLEVCFKRPKKIVAIASQGRQDMNQWVTKYRLTFSMDKTHYVYYKQLGVTKVCCTKISEQV